MAGRLVAGGDRRGVKAGASSRGFVCWPQGLPGAQGPWARKARRVTGHNGAPGQNGPPGEKGDPGTARAFAFVDPTNCTGPSVICPIAQAKNIGEARRVNPGQ